MKRAALYLRVSTKGQTTENQRLELAEVSKAKGWEITQIYEDAGVSGAKGREMRSAYDQMLKDAVRAKFDILMSWDVSRLGRSLAGLVQGLDELQANGVDLYLHQQAIDTTTPSGKALFQMAGVFAEFERSIIRDRVKAGLARARASGRKLGRPHKQIDRMALWQDRCSGMSVRALSKKYNISIGTVHALTRSASTEQTASLVATASEVTLSL